MKCEFKNISYLLSLINYVYELFGKYIKFINIDRRGGQRTRIERELTNKSTIRSLFLATPLISER